MSWIWFGCRQLLVMSRNRSSLTSLSKSANNPWRSRMTPSHWHGGASLCSRSDRHGAAARRKRTSGSHFFAAGLDLLARSALSQMPAPVLRRPAKPQRKRSNRCRCFIGFACFCITMRAAAATKCKCRRRRVLRVRDAREACRRPEQFVPKSAARRDVVFAAASEARADLRFLADRLDAEDGQSQWSSA